VPKMKSHSGMTKRVKVTGSGKLLRRQSGRGHNRLAKGGATFRRRDGLKELAPGDAKVARRLLGG